MNLLLGVKGANTINGTNTTARVTDNKARFVVVVKELSELVGKQEVLG